MSDNPPHEIKRVLPVASGALSGVGGVSAPVKMPERTEGDERELRQGPGAMKPQLPAIVPELAAASLEIAQAFEVRVSELVENHVGDVVASANEMRKEALWYALAFREQVYDTLRLNAEDVLHFVGELTSAQGPHDICIAHATFFDRQQQLFYKQVRDWQTAAETVVHEAAKRTLSLLFPFNF